MSAGRVWEVTVPNLGETSDTLHAAAAIAMFNPEVIPVILAEDEANLKALQDTISSAAEESEYFARIHTRIHRDN